MIFLVKLTRDENGLINVTKINPEITLDKNGLIRINKKDHENAFMEALVMYGPKYAIKQRYRGFV